MVHSRPKGDTSIGDAELMPNYGYSCEACEEIFIEFHAVEDAWKPQPCPVCTQMARYVPSCGSIAAPSTREITSESMGVWPGQQAEATAYANAKGCTGFEFDKTGMLHFPGGKPARKNFAEVHGFSDRDGQFNDPAPQSQSKLEERIHEDIEQGLVAEDRHATSESGHDSDGD